MNATPGARKPLANKHDQMSQPESTARKGKLVNVIATLSSGEKVIVTIARQVSSHAMFHEIQEKVRDAGHHSRVIAWEWEDYDALFGTPAAPEPPKE